MGRKEDLKVNSNLRRCPLLKITKKVILDGGIEETYEEFNDCYRSFCMAWDEDTKSCSYFTSEEELEEEED